MTNSGQSLSTGRAKPLTNNSSRRRGGRYQVNITPQERTGRILIGLAAMAAGAVLFATGGSLLVVVLELMLVLAGLDLVVTGALGHCPLYQRLGYVPSTRGNRRDTQT